MGLLTAAADLYAPPPNPWLHDPAGWVRERTGEHLWSKQIEIARAVEEHRKVAVKACHGPGKSFLAARLVTWWIDTRHTPSERARAVTSAPTNDQVEGVLWQELRTAHGRAGLDGRVGLDCVWRGPSGVEYAIGRKPPDHAESAFQGWHARRMLVVFDEACGIPKQLWDAGRALITNEDGRFLAIGNPTDPTSEFAKNCAGAPEDGTSGMSKLGWWVITISAFDTPAYTGEPVPIDVLANLTSKTWVEEEGLAFGTESPLYVAKVLGQFPKDATAGVVPWSWIQKCQGPEATARIGGLRVPVELGVDVGGSENGDESVIVCREGMRASGELRRIRTADSEVLADEVIAAVRATGATSVKVDHTGIGWGVTGSLKRRLPREADGPPVEVHGVLVGEAAQQRDRFVDLKAEIWWQVGREYSRQGVWDLTEMDEQTTIELSEPRYFDQNGRIRVEKKSEVRKRLGRSPDSADALLLAFYEPPVVPPVQQTQWKDNRHKGRW